MRSAIPSAPCNGTNTSTCVTTAEYPCAINQSGCTDLQYQVISVCKDSMVNNSIKYDWIQKTQAPTVGTATQVPNYVEPGKIPAYVGRFAEDTKRCGSDNGGKYYTTDTDTCYGAVCNGYCMCNSVLGPKDEEAFCIAI